MREELERGLVGVGPEGDQLAGDLAALAVGEK